MMKPEGAAGFGDGGGGGALIDLRVFLLTTFFGPLTRLPVVVAVVVVVEDVVVESYF
jgi:hypothetical protein